MDRPNTGKRGCDGRISSGERQPIPKGENILSRAIHALDFRSRECSGNEPDDIARGHGIRLPSLQKTARKESDPNISRHAKIATEIKAYNGLYEKAQPNKHQIPPYIDDYLQVAKANEIHTPFSRNPQHIQITSADMSLTVNAVKSSHVQDGSTWITAVVSASIDDSMGGMDINGRPSADIPLDIMILVDNSARVTEDLLKAACRNAFRLASALDILIDRIAICCISPDPTQSLNILMPLSTYSLDTARILFRSLPAFQLPHGESSRSRFAGAIKEASNYLIRHSSRGALCHMFLVTAGSTVLIPGDCNGDKLRYHTISPENAMMIRSQQSLEGWHIGTSFDNEECNLIASTFKEKLQFVIKHLRVGVDSGYLNDLSLRLEAGPGSHIEAILGDITRDTLRLGESWAILVKIKPTPGLENAIGGGPAPRFGDDEPYTPSESTVDRMIDQLQGMLKPGVYTTESEYYISATLEYKHSALSDNTVIMTKGKCIIPSFHRTVTWDDDVKSPTPRDNSRIVHRQYLKSPCDNEMIRVKKRQQIVSKTNGYGLQRKSFGKENSAPPLSLGGNHLVYRDTSPFGSMNPYNNICKRDDFLLAQQSLDGIPEYGQFSHSSAQMN
ncbi:hypothetical protein McanMca71_000031 [Microsporum canis]